MVDEHVNILHWSTDSKQTTSRDCTTTNVENISVSALQDTCSEFGGSDCGEPLYAQHLRIDFTPNEEDDNEFAQKKCCQFWDFIKTLPQIQNFMVYPEKCYEQLSTTSLTTKNSSESDVKEKALDVGRTAVSTLNLAQQKGFINRAFEAKMPQSSCTLGSREYKELEEVKKYKKRMKQGTCCSLRLCPCKTGPSGASCTESATKDPSTLKNMMKDMEDWDAKHPKSMEPPGHPPSLQHCVLQRAYYSISP